MLVADVAGLVPAAVAEWSVQDWGAAANVVMAAAAIAALWYAFVQVRSSREDTREATAKHIWSEYHLNGLEYPELANPDLSKLDYKKMEYGGDAAKFHDYTWFVSFMLLACDELLRLGGGADDWDWEQIVKNNIKWHWDYIESSAFDEREVLSPRLLRKIDQIREDKDSEGDLKVPSSL
jgi:hypothetical protein